MTNSKKLHPMEEAMSKGSKKDLGFIKIILNVVSQETNISPANILKVCRKREIVTTRQIAMTLSSIMTTASLSKIGLILGGKDHATVLHARKNIFNLYDTHLETKHLVTRIFNILSMHTNHSLVCEICGSSEIQKKAWIDPNSLLHIKYPRTNNKEDNYCRKCQAYVKFIQISEYLIYDGQHTVEAISD